GQITSLGIGDRPPPRLACSSAASVQPVYLVSCISGTASHCRLGLGEALPSRKYEPPLTRAGAAFRSAHTSLRFQARLTTPTVRGRGRVPPESPHRPGASRVPRPRSPRRANRRKARRR